MKRLAWWLLALALLFCVRAAYAGEIRLDWQAGTSGPVAEGYRVSWGITTPPTTELDVGNVLTWAKPDMDNCTTHYFTVRAYVSAAESQPSVEVSAYPRPDVTNVLDSEIGTQAIMGNNFDTNLKVFVDAGAGLTQLPPADVTRVSCTEIRIPDIPLFQVLVANVALPLGVGEPKDVFSQPWPGPVVTVE